ncbi:MAG: S-methyl-5-thioribose-1-phosphate isomerase [Chloroflexi bacterium]|nr:S-methyl-5-thioribose-1-phosphate isomerase [Chloroflexota bacterium]
MKVNGRDYRAVWWDGDAIGFIDQRLLPHRFETATAGTVAQVAHAIKDMAVRGAPTIGVMGAYGMALAARNGDSLDAAYDLLLNTRPTAINLKVGLDAVMSPDRTKNPDADAMLDAAHTHDDDEVAAARAIGRHGATLLAHGSRILTHCNAGWLAAQDWGTATSPVYTAAREGLSPFVWVSETRPRLQGARITAWEMVQEGIDHRLTADAAAAQLMRQRRVDIVITGADRIAANGDTANKIGTYSHALAARANGVPFYVAAPLTTFDRDTPDGEAIPIEERDEDEVVFVEGLSDDGVVRRVRVPPVETLAINPAFDMTPADLITGFITEVGIVPATPDGIADAFRRPRPS